MNCNLPGTSLGLLLATFWLATSAAFGQSSAPTNNGINVEQRLERQHLQATHEAHLQFAKARTTVPTHGLYEDFRAVLHAHPPPLRCDQQELLAAARKAGIRVLLSTDNPFEGHSGLQNGILFISGSNTSKGTLWFPEFGSNASPIPRSGLRFASSTAEESDFLPERISGFIISSQTGAVQKTLLENADTARWSKVLDAFRTFPDEFFAAGTEHHPGLLEKWDDEADQHCTGVAANDVAKSEFRKVDFAPYEISFRHSVTHILAQDLTESLVRDALTNGHAYVAHDWLCDPTGFMFGAVNNLGVYTMGDTIPMLGTTRLTAITPLAAKLRLFHKGEVVNETFGTNLTFQAKEPGAYRIEAWLSVDGEERPWIYSNPVYLKTMSPDQMRLPSMAISPEVGVHKGIVYLEGPEEESSKHKLDIYVPKEKTNAPVFFFIHGGAWRSGDRSQYPPLGNRYAREGFVTVVPSYRLAPKYPHPAQIEDVATAFAWTVRHVSEYGGDTNRLYVGGHSAGGHLAALLSLDESRLAKHDLSPKIIRGVLALSGVYNLVGTESQESVFGTDPDVRRSASPLFHIKAGAPPFVVTYCQWDYFTLPAQAREFHRALEKASVHAKLVYVPAQNHLSEMLNVTSTNDPTVAAAVRFIK